ncbi:MAG: precorrin-6A reductase [Lachnospiraceae bacterium]|nr:precorrin-6A reductase [Lachnospiraceae bacterium]
MKEILIFAGTTEGRELAELLSEQKIPSCVCVATEYGRLTMGEKKNIRVNQGRMSAEEMKTFIQPDKFLAVVDATHPFAIEVTEHIKESLKDKKIPYLRLERIREHISNQDNQIYVKNHTEAAGKLLEMDGNILLTTGVKNLAKYCQIPELKKRLYVRVLPSLESIRQCEEMGICGKQIIAMQGPFTVEMNKAVLQQYHINCLVTKASGKTGGFPEKLEAAEKTGVKVLIVDGTMPEETGLDLENICKRLMELTGKDIPTKHKLEISLIGMGMGQEENLTGEAKHRIQRADLLLGADRLIESCSGTGQKISCYKPNDIVSIIEEWYQNSKDTCTGKKIAILYSGDTGFYSGMPAVYQRLQQEKERIPMEIRIYPGISAVSYLAAKMGKSWQDAILCSIHGREANVWDLLRTNEKLFLLVSGLTDVQKFAREWQQMIGEKTEQNDPGIFFQITCTIGYQLSYPEEYVQTMTPEQMLTLKQDGLYILYLENSAWTERKLTHGRSDDYFVRGKVPMTKEEIRDIVICKLGLQEKSILYDIGSGTGSIAVESASLSPSITVYAIERNQEGIALIHQNAKLNGLTNIKIVEGEAPVALEQLQAPTHVFIGGSGGRLQEILQLLSQKRSQIRVVLTAITLETVAEITRLANDVTDLSICQVQVNRTRNAGKYHLFQAENPVFIFSFTLQGEADD